MGIPQLIAAADQIGQPAPSFLVGTGEAAILCVEDLLLVLAQTTGLLTSFIALLQTLITFIELQVKALGLFVDTLLLQIDILTPLIQEYNVLKAQLASELTQFGIGKFVACPPVLALQNAMVNQASGVPYLGAAFDGVRTMEGQMAKWQLQVINWQQQIAAITASIATQNALVKFLHGIINAINAQFPGN